MTIPISFNNTFSFYYFYITQSIPITFTYTSSLFRRYVTKVNISNWSSTQTSLDIRERLSRSLTRVKVTGMRSLSCSRFPLIGHLTLSSCKPIKYNPFYTIHNMKQLHLYKPFGLLKPK